MFSRMDYNKYRWCYILKCTVIVWLSHKTRLMRITFMVKKNQKYSKADCCGKRSEGMGGIKIKANCLCKHYQSIESWSCAAEITCMTKMWNLCEIVVGNFEGKRPIGKIFWWLMINWVIDTFPWVFLVTPGSWQCTSKILLLVTACL
jgi:hypothetical protein